MLGLYSVVEGFRLQHLLLRVLRNAGTYLISFGYSYASGSSNVGGGIGLNINGTAPSNNNLVLPSQDTGAAMISYTIVMVLSAGTTIQLQNVSAVTMVLGPASNSTSATGGITAYLIVVRVQ